MNECIIIINELRKMLGLLSLPEDRVRELESVEDYAAEVERLENPHSFGRPRQFEDVQVNCAVNGGYKIFFFKQDQRIATISVDPKRRTISLATYLTSVNLFNIMFDLESGKLDEEFTIVSSIFDRIRDDEGQFGMELLNLVTNSFQWAHEQLENTSLNDGLAIWCELDHYRHYHRSTAT